jgi:hypothetical protein
VPEHLTHEHFAPYVNQTFRVQLESSTVDLVLMQADRLAHHGSMPDGRPPFSLVFRGPWQPRLTQKIHRLEHATLGALDIFIVPIGPDRLGMLYEAIFN